MTKRDETETDFPVTGGTIDAAMEIGKRRAEALREIKAVLLQGEDDRALGLMRKLFGISAEHDAKDSQGGT